jgi:hypothetical protein
LGIRIGTGADETQTVDSYRAKVATTMTATGKDIAGIAPHFETRVGKRRWNERSKKERRSVDA